VKAQPIAATPAPVQVPAKVGKPAAPGADAHAKKAKAEDEPMSPHSAVAGEAPATTENQPGAAALLTTADARGGTAAPDEPMTDPATDPTAQPGGAAPDTPSPATAAAPTADSAPTGSSTPDDAGSAAANGSGGLRAP
jgi:hypothetical protein